MMKKVLGILMLLILFGEMGNTQQSAIGVNFGYGYFLPGGDLAERYGGHLGFSFNTEYQAKNNLNYFLEWRYLFGSTVKSDVLAPLRQEDGLLIGTDGLAADVYYRMRGQHFVLGLSKAIGQKRSKAIVGGGLGWIFYKTSIRDDNRSYIQPTGLYEQLYDQRTNGPLVKVLAGYHLKTDNDLINLKILFDVGYGFSSFNKLSPYNPITKSSLKDLSAGITAYWFIPFRKYGGSEEIKYF